MSYTENLHSLQRKIQTLINIGDGPKNIKYDTETSGLHIKKDMPFLGAIAYRTPSGLREAVVFPTTKDNLMLLKWFSDKVEYIYAHNTVYDMHMTANITGDELVLSIRNWADTQGLLRLSLEAKSPRNGGDKIGLKIIANKYIDPDAERYEKAVKGWLSEQESANRKILIAILKPLKWGIKKFEDALKKDLDSIPPEIMRIYTQWQADYPEPNYSDVPMGIMMPYVASDVILTDILEEITLPVVLDRKQESTMEREFKNLRSTFKMTRRGFKIDRPYLRTCQVRMHDYIKDLTKEMHTLAGREFNVGQHALIKDMYTEILGSRPKSTDNQFLKKRIAQGDRLALLIKKLRTLEKWNATYLEKMLAQSEYDGRLYASLNQFGTVTGRHSGDFQQMPKAALLTLEGDVQKKDAGGDWSPGEKGCDPSQELFHPRKSVIVDKGSKLFYLDFSQEELRFQANFTLPLGGDLNLCRAYMPFKCVHYQTGELYEYRTAEGRKRWLEMQEGTPNDASWEVLLNAGNSAWIVPDTLLSWVPTDVHGATAKEALKIMGIDPDTCDKKVFKMWRGIGKTYNFMKTYGGGPEKSAEVLDITVEECTAIDDGFVKSFPTIIAYQQAIIQTFRRRGYITNMYGRRYYLSDDRSFYQGGNYMIQGSCADDLKEKILKIDEFFESHSCKSQILMPIHDELAFEIYDDEQWVVPHLTEIMMNCPDLLVPLVVEPDYTETCWSEKKAFVA